MQNEVLCLQIQKTKLSGLNFSKSYFLNPLGPFQIMSEYLYLKYKKIALSYVYLLNPISDLIKFYIIKQQKKYSTFTDEKRDENELLYYLLLEKNAKIIFSMTYSVEFLYDFTFFSME